MNVIRHRKGRKKRTENEDRKAVAKNTSSDAYCQANRMNHPKNKFYFPILPVGCQECRYHKFSVCATKAKKEHGIRIDLRTAVREETKFLPQNGSLFWCLWRNFSLLNDNNGFGSAFVVALQPICTRIHGAWNANTTKSIPVHHISNQRSVAGIIFFDFCSSHFIAKMKRIKFNGFTRIRFSWPM